MELRWRLDTNSHRAQNMKNPPLTFSQRNDTDANSRGKRRRVSTDQAERRMVTCSRDYRGYKPGADSPVCVSLLSRNKKGKRFRFRRDKMTISGGKPRPSCCRHVDVLFYFTSL